jgi:hypothetical protein
LLGKTIIYNKGKAWSLKIFCIQLEEAFGSLYLHLSIVSWRHYQPYTLFSYMYSRSAPFCMRSAIYLIKLDLRYLWLFLVLFVLHLVEYIPLLYLYHLLAANTQRTITINPTKLKKTKICKVFDKIPQPKHIKP